MTTSQPSFFGLARPFPLGFIVVGLFSGALALLVAGVTALREQEFAANGVVTTGIVLEKQSFTADSDSSTEYRVVYRFTTPDGRVVEGSNSVEVGVWEGLVERGPIEIQYLRDRPETNRLTSGSAFSAALGFLLLAVVLGGIGGVGFFHALRGVVKARRLLRIGVPADASVTEVAPTNVSHNGRRQFRVRYSYVDGQGGTHAGQSGYMSSKEAHLWTPGDVARIRYDPGRPEESHWLADRTGSPKAPRKRRPSIRRRP